MKEIIQNLLKLQALQFGDVTAKDAESLIIELRTKIPPPVLGHFDRLTTRGKRGVAIVRNQVCTGCHMRLPIGLIATLLRGEDIQVCETCGRYLYLPAGPEDQFLRHLETRQPALARKKLKDLAHVA